MSWLLRIETTAPSADTISELLWRFGTTGIAERGSPSACDRPGATTLLAGFDGEAAAHDAQSAVQQLDCPIVSSTVEAATTEAWVDDDLRGHLHLPTGSIELAVGTAFGHGAHPTTQLALDLLLATMSPGDAILDFGTGTGVLAVAAAATGATSIVAVDNDPAALAVAEANLLANPGVATILVTDSLPEPAEARFDVIVANVLLDVHRHHGPSLAEKLAPAASLIISGVLTSQRDAVLTAYPSLTAIEERSDHTLNTAEADDRWIGLRLVSNG